MTHEQRILSAFGRILTIGMRSALPAIENAFPSGSQDREHFTDAMCYYHASQYDKIAPKLSDFTNFSDPQALEKFLIQLEECARQSEIVPPVNVIPQGQVFAVGGM